MSHEQGQQGRTLLVLLTLLLHFTPGGITRTVIIGQGRKIIADLGERPVPQLAPRPRIGETGFLSCQVTNNNPTRQTWPSGCSTKKGQ